MSCCPIWGSKPPPAEEPRAAAAAAAGAGQPPAPTLLSRERRQPQQPEVAGAEECCCREVPCVGGGWASPLEAFHHGEREELMYITAVMNNGLDGADKPDYLATIDLDPGSPTYSQVIHRLQMPQPGDELHHMGWNACSSCHGKPGVSTHNHLVVPGVISGNVYFVDVKSDPRAPRFHKTIEAKELAEKAGVGLPHTTHCAPTEIIMSFLGGPKEEGFPSAGTGFVSLNPETLEIIGRWEQGPRKPTYGYDFWYQPQHNVMISSELGEPLCFLNGFDPDHVADGKYGRKLYVWDWTERTMLQELDLGLGAIPLEVRFLHDPSKAEGFVGCALTSEVVRFFKKPDNSWATEVVVKIPSVLVEGFLLPEMPALITDFLLSLDDRFMYVSCWLHGDVRQYDITDTRSPRLVGQVYVGGSLKKGGPVKSRGGEQQPEPLVVNGVEVQGGAQMLQLSLDGKRLYVSTSLFSSWDRQFYPDLKAKGAQVVMLDVDTRDGGLTVNPDFLVDFGKEPFGPALCHEMRFPGGDCTSDIWL